jgi:RNA polymerase sigma-70 factor (ECF subfamily)
VLRPDETQPDTAKPARSESSLIRAVLAGNAAAQDTFVGRMRCVPRILSVLNARRGAPLDEHALADLAQDTMLVIWRKLSEFREPSTLEAWAYGIAYLEFRNAARRRARTRLRNVALSPDAEPISGETHETEPAPVDDIETALSRLDAEDYAVIRLRHDENLSFDAIGQHLGVPMNTAKTRYHRSLKRLREWLSQKTNQDEHPR